MRHVFLSSLTLKMDPNTNDGTVVFEAKQCTRGNVDGLCIIVSWIGKRLQLDCYVHETCVESASVIAHRLSDKHVQSASDTSVELHSDTAHTLQVKCPRCTLKRSSLSETSRLMNFELRDESKDESLSSCEALVKDPCSVCGFCDFMTYSSYRLENHIRAQHPEALVASQARSTTRTVAASVSSRIRLADTLFYADLSNKSLISDVSRHETPPPIARSSSPADEELLHGRNSDKGPKGTTEDDSTTDTTLSSADFGVSSVGPEARQTELSQTDSTQSLLLLEASPAACGNPTKDSVTGRLAQSHASTTQKTEDKGQANVKATTRRWPLVCKECSHPFLRWVDFHAHVRAHYQGNLFKCGICPLTFSRRENLDLHAKTHAKPSHAEGRGAVSCRTTRAKPLSRPRNLKADVSAGTVVAGSEKPKKKYCRPFQMAKPTKERPFKCHECGKLFKVHNCYVNHVKRHKGEVPYTCSICHTTFTDKISRQRHMMEHPGEKLFKCVECGRGFNQSHSYRHHMRTHSGVKPYKCTECGKRFFWKASMDTHRRLHTGKDLIKCQVCGRKFPKNAGFTRHMRTHTGEKPFECHVCGKCFNDPGSHKKHLRIHTGERPYQCEECGKTFSRAGTFKDHLRRHTGVKTHKCGVCGKSFSDKHGVVRHEKRHYQENSRFFLNHEQAASGDQLLPQPMYESGAHSDSGTYDSHFGACRMPIVAPVLIDGPPEPPPLTASNASTYTHQTHLATHYAYTH